MISKELLSEVLGYKVQEILPILKEEQNTLIFYREYFKDYGKSIVSNINIYELAHECKEWAYNQGYFVLVQKVNKKYVLLLIKNDECIECCGYIQETKVVKEPRYYDTEEEAMFQGCEYIKTRIAS